MCSDLQRVGHPPGKGPFPLAAVKRIPYSWCLTSTRIAGNLIAPRLVRATESGRKLTLEVIDSNLQTIATSPFLNLPIKAGRPRHTSCRTMSNEHTAQGHPRT